MHVNSRAATPLADLRERYGSDDAMPHRHAVAYFDMAYRVSPTAVHVISSGLPAVTNHGPKGGSAVAAAAMNALLYFEEG